MPTTAGPMSCETVTLTPSTSPSVADRKRLRSCIDPIANVARASMLIADHPRSSHVSDPTRRAVLEQLREGPQAVGEIAAHLPVSRPAVSQHLKVLKDAGLVSDRAQGARRLYEVDSAGLAALRAHLDGFWNRALLSFRDAAEAQGGGDGDRTP